MEKRSWLWVFDAFTLDDSLCCIYIFPLVIIKNRKPLKIIYSDTNGRLSFKKQPRITEIIDVFKQTLKINSPNHMIKGYDITGNYEYLNEEDFLDEFKIYSFIALQAVKENNLRYYHKVEFTNKCYNSIPYIEKENGSKAINDISLEKILLVYSVNVIRLLEKRKACNVNNIEIIYTKDKAGRFWLENIKDCLVSRLDIQRPSILQSKIVIHSSKSEKEQKKFAKFKTSELNNTQIIVAKPKFRISSTKLSESILPKIQKNKSVNDFKVCYGYYCNKEITVISITRSRKVSARIFGSLSHELIKKCLKAIQLPLPEAEFNEIFSKEYKDLIEGLYNNSFIHRKFQFHQQDFDKSDTIKLCPVCYKIFLIASRVEMPLMNY